MRLRYKGRIVGVPFGLVYPTVLYSLYFDQGRTSLTVFICYKEKLLGEGIGAVPINGYGDKHLEITLN